MPARLKAERDDARVEEDVDEMEAHRRRAEERAIERVRRDRQRPVEPVVLTGDVPVRLDEQLRKVRERFDGRVALDEPDVVQSEAVVERAPVDEDGDEGAQ